MHCSKPILRTFCTIGMVCQPTTCSEGFTGADVAKIIELSCELELDICREENLDEAGKCQSAVIHAINALLLLVSRDRSLEDTIAKPIAP